MGASGWSYYVPYQADVNKALQDLRQKVFEEGDYYKAWEPADIENEFVTAYYEKFKSEGSEPEEPQTIEELIELAATEGTHSIIDMEGVFLEALPKGEEGEFGTVYPLSAEDLLELFGTDKPTRETIELVEKEDPGLLLEYTPAPQTGIYITFYNGDRPDGYFFSGYSGD